MLVMLLLFVQLCFVQLGLVFAAIVCAVKALFDAILFVLLNLFDKFCCILDAVVIMLSLFLLLLFVFSATTAGKLYFMVMCIRH